MLLYLWRTKMLQTSWIYTTSQSYLTIFSIKPDVDERHLTVF